MNFQGFLTGSSSTPPEADDVARVRFVSKPVSEDARLAFEEGFDNRYDPLERNKSCIPEKY